MRSRRTAFVRRAIIRPGLSDAGAVMIAILSIPLIIMISIPITRVASIALARTFLHDRAGCEAGESAP